MMVHFQNAPAKEKQDINFRELLEFPYLNRGLTVFSLCFVYVSSCMMV